MTSVISFSLLCKKNPTIVSTDDIQNVVRLDIDNSNISHIDNLELFSHIRELNLSHNILASLKNLEIMTDLTFLDVSFNNISSEELLRSVKYIPPTLSTIVLSGNPCCNDEAALSKFQDALPEIAIAIDVEEESTQNSSISCANDFEDKDEIATGQEPTVLQSHQPVNSDEVLKFIVDRKCKLQSLQTLNVENIIKELNEEADSALKSSRAGRKLKHSSDVASFSNYDIKIEQRIREMKERNEEAKTAFEEVVGRLRTTAESHISNLHSSRK